jgi:hypothetical protein
VKFVNAHGCIWNSHVSCQSTDKLQNKWLCQIKISSEICTYLVEVNMCCMCHVCKTIRCLLQIFFTHKEINSEVFDLNFTVMMMMMMIHLCNASNEVCLRT